MWCLMLSDRAAERVVPHSMSFQYADDAYWTNRHQRACATDGSNAVEVVGNEIGRAKGTASLYLSAFISYLIPMSQDEKNE